MAGSGMNKLEVTVHQDLCTVVNAKFSSKILIIFVLGLELESVVVICVTSRFSS